MPVVYRGKLILLVDHAGHRVGKFGTLDPVHDHASHRQLALVGLIIRLRLDNGRHQGQIRLGIALHRPGGILLLTTLLLLLGNLLSQAQLFVGNLLIQPFLVRLQLRDLSLELRLGHLGGADFLVFGGKVGPGIVYQRIHLLMLGAQGVLVGGQLRLLILQLRRLRRDVLLQLIVLLQHLLIVPGDAVGVLGALHELRDGTAGENRDQHGIVAVLVHILDPLFHGLVLLPGLLLRLRKLRVQIIDVLAGGRDGFLRVADLPRHRLKLTVEGTVLSLQGFGFLLQTVRPVLRVLQVLLRVLRVLLRLLFLLLQFIQTGCPHGLPGCLGKSQQAYHAKNQHALSSVLHRGHLTFPCRFLLCFPLFLSICRKC